MSFFTPAQVAELRAEQESTFADTCTIADPSHKASGGGQQWTTRAGTFACGVSSLSQAIQTGQLTIVPDLPGDETAFVFALPVTVAPIKQAARIGWKGATYEVRTVEEPGSYPMQVQVVAVRR